jgi:predicted ArsR family transcriptional regulator
MVAILLRSEKWTHDRMTATGPNFRAEPAKPARPTVERDPALKARVLSVLQRGPATGDAIAKALHRPQQEVSAKLSRLFRDGHVERSLSATSAATGRRVLVYTVKADA